MGSVATPYGFEWGPAKVSRVATVHRGNGEYRILSVGSAKTTVEITITPTGLMRVFKDGKELA